MGVNYITNQAPDGSTLGYNENELISFYGATPIAQRASANQAAVATTAISAVATTAGVAVATTAALSTSAFGFSTAAQADAIVTAVNYLLTQSSANMTAVNLIITRAEAIRVLANELRLSLVPTTGVGLISGAA